MIGWLLLGLLLLKGREVNMRLCQRRNAQAGMVEEARTLCLRNGEVTWGREGHSGSPSEVRINPGCPEGGKVLGIWHLHPGGTTEPSSQDLKAMEQAGLEHMCISDDYGVVCHRVIER